MGVIITWNVNGIRAAEKKGFFDFLEAQKPDILCIQETKATPDQLTKKFITPLDYTSYWSSAEKKGYSGVTVYSRVQPNKVEYMNDPQFDDEGRYIQLSFDSLEVINTYFPNSQPEGKRLPYKLAFCDAIMKRCNTLVAKKKNFILCGDLNIAHKAIDLARPEANETSPGYLPEERLWMDSFIDAGYVDVFRHFCKEPGQYTWWSYRANARTNNVGWRLDYHVAPPYAIDKISNVDIMSDILGSDHCPVRLTTSMV